MIMEVGFTSQFVQEAKKKGGNEGKKREFSNRFTQFWRDTRLGRF